MPGAKPVPRITSRNGRPSFATLVTTGFEIGVDGEPIVAMNPFSEFPGAHAHRASTVPDVVGKSLENVCPAAPAGESFTATAVARSSATPPRYVEKSVLEPSAAKRVRNASAKNPGA